MVGIRDVARKANVSPATVSRVLNNDQTIDVAQTTRQRIVEAAAALDYDISTRKYIKKRMPSIGVISTIGKASEETGYLLQTFASRDGRRSSTSAFRDESNL